MILETYIDDILNSGLEKNYWFMTKQNLSDFYLPFFVAGIVESYPVHHKSSENFGTYYSRCFREDAYALSKYPKQAESENTYRNAITAEFLGLFYREGDKYDTGIVTDAYKILKKYIKNHDDVLKYRYLIDRQIEKLCLNVNEKASKYEDVKSVTIFPVIFLYKVLLELKERTGSSDLFYDEFLFFVVRTQNYECFSKVVDLIIEYRKHALNEEYIEKSKSIINDDVTTGNIRFDDLIGSLQNIEYTTNRRETKKFGIKESQESFSYIQTVVDIYEHSDYAKEKNKTSLLNFQRSDKYFIGKLETISKVFIEKEEPEEETKMEDTITKLPEIEKRSDFTHPLNSILYGAPGTGKTYSTIEYALSIVEKRETSSRELSNKERIQLMKTYQNYADCGQIVFTTFHQNYGYEDFIQGLRPDLNGDGFKFIPVDGIFKKIAEKAMANPTSNYVLIVDEINRANISKVLGELITLIEEDKRWGELNQLSVTLPSGQIFAVPNNLYIVGTMNTADKSISLIDVALRRRFDFIEQKVDYSLVLNPLLKKVLLSINNTLADEFESTDLLIGHAYFIGKNEDDFIGIMNKKIIPLLYEYYSDNSKKVELLLNNALKETGFELCTSKNERLRIKRTEELNA